MLLTLLIALQMLGLIPPAEAEICDRRSMLRRSLGCVDSGSGVIRFVDSLGSVVQ